MAYELTGNFVECCDCFTVCPCWVNDLPDEDHCSGLYLWSFGKHSRIDGVDVGGTAIAAATFHAVRAGGQAMFFVDAAGKGPRVERLLYNAFSGKDENSDLTALSKLLGVYLGCLPAEIRCDFSGNEFEVEVTLNGQAIAKARGHDKQFQGQGETLKLSGSALNDKLGIGTHSVIVQTMCELTMDVAALPGGPLKFRGRSGMRSQFRYSHRGTTPVTAPDEEQPADAEA